MKPHTFLSTLVLLALPVVATAHATITYSPARGIGPEAGVMRRDPSDIIRVKDLYYLWYSKGKVSGGYDATIWYATSPDGHAWTEKGEAVARGEEGSWDAQSVFTPNILVSQGRYWLFYTGIAKAVAQEGMQATKTALGLAVANSPDGPWDKPQANPILEPTTDANAFDSMRLDDACLLVRGDEYWLYYKGRKLGVPPTQTRMGLAIAAKPGGPYAKYAGNPVFPGGHEVAVWPVGKGVAAMISIGPEGIGRTIQYAPDGLTFSKWQNLKSVPHAAGLYRPEAFTGNATGTMPEWGVHIGSQKGFLPFIERFDCKGSATPPQESNGAAPQSEPSSKQGKT